MLQEIGGPNYTFCCFKKENSVQKWNLQSIRYFETFEAYNFIYIKKSQMNKRKRLRKSIFPLSRYHESTSVIF